MIFAEYERRWIEFKNVVHSRDVLIGKPYRRGSSLWLVDIGAPFLANLDDIDAEPDSVLDENQAFEVMIRFHHDVLMMPFVTNRKEALLKRHRNVTLTPSIRGEVVWPPPTAITE